MCVCVCVSECVCVCVWVCVCVCVCVIIKENKRPLFCVNMVTCVTAVPYIWSKLQCRSS
ncbi:MAG: hypothetical protein PV344_09290 [Anaplasma sp.]|nr:hypothetical protein [Anaplasma sp.]